MKKRKTIIGLLWEATLSFFKLQFFVRGLRQQGNIYSARFIFERISIPRSMYLSLEFSMTGTRSADFSIKALLHMYLLPAGR